MTTATKTLFALPLVALSTLLFACNGDPCLDDGPAKGVCVMDSSDETGGWEDEGEDEGCHGETGGEGADSGEDEGRDPGRCDSGDDGEDDGRDDGRGCGHDTGCDSGDDGEDSGNDSGDDGETDGEDSGDDGRCDGGDDGETDGEDSGNDSGDDGETDGEDTGCDSGDDGETDGETDGGDQGCTLTQGYWKNHGNWPLSPATMTCDMTWQEILETPTKGNPWFILAHQYIAAELNVASGASVPGEVQLALDIAADMLAPCAVDPADHEEATAWATILDDYNNGLIGPGHCG